MIAQLLNRQFIREQLQDVRVQLEKDVGENRQGGVAGTNHLTSEDYRSALELVKQAEASEFLQSSGQPSFETSEAERRGGSLPASLDDFSFFSRAPLINLWQSTLEQYFEERATVENERVEERELPDDRRSAGIEVMVTDRSLPGLSPSRVEDGRRIFNKFSITDIGWVSCWLAEGIRLFRHKHDFNERPPEPLRIADRARILLVGDWATGLPRARNVSRQMRRLIDEGQAENREVHVVHLGDVYYSGFEREYKNRFLPYWPVKPDEAQNVGSWSLNANHDMYSGGYGYYDFLLSDERFRRQGQASYFELFNRHWQIIGLDTGWEEGDLKDPQAEWIQTSINSSGRKVMLLSHHQLFSAYERTSRAIGDKLKSILQAGRIRSWFWGHEHRCMLYKEHQNVPFARCIGHGGVPVYMSHSENEPYPEPGIYEYRAWIDGGLEQWALMGFAVLDFEEASIGVQYINEYGNVHKTELIQ